MSSAKNFILRENRFFGTDNRNALSNGELLFYEKTGAGCASRAEAAAGCGDLRRSRKVFGGTAQDADAAAAWR